MQHSWGTDRLDITTLCSKFTFIQGKYLQCTAVFKVQEHSSLCKLAMLHFLFADGLLSSDTNILLVLALEYYLTFLLPNPKTTFCYRMKIIPQAFFPWNFMRTLMPSQAAKQTILPSQMKDAQIFRKQKKTYYQKLEKIILKLFFFTIKKRDSL